MIRRIKSLLADIEYKIMHIFRESNMAADSLANWGVVQAKGGIVSDRDLPKKVKGIVRLDRIGLPNVRFKKL